MQFSGIFPAMPCVTASPSSSTPRQMRQQPVQPVEEHVHLSEVYAEIPSPIATSSVFAGVLALAPWAVLFYTGRKHVACSLFREQTEADTWTLQRTPARLALEFKRRFQGVAYWAVALGGLLGAISRYVVSGWIGTPSGFPFATLATNLAGSFFLAWFYTLTMNRFPVHPHVRLGIGTGFVGAFTTFSTFSLEMWHLWLSHQFLFAGIYFVGSLVGGMMFALAGYRIAVGMGRLRTTRNAEEWV